MTEQLPPGVEMPDETPSPDASNDDAKKVTPPPLEASVPLIWVVREGEVYWGTFLYDNAKDAWDRYHELPSEIPAVLHNGIEPGTWVVTFGTGVESETLPELKYDELTERHYYGVAGV